VLRRADQVLEFAVLQLRFVDTGDHDMVVRNGGDAGSSLSG
jgi:hypothetical protein